MDKVCRYIGVPVTWSIPHGCDEAIDTLPRICCYGFDIRASTLFYAPELFYSIGLGFHL